MFLPPARARIAQLSASHAGQLHLTPRAGNYYLAMGTTTPPFDDVRVRRALNVAVDRAAVGRLFGPTGRPTCQILPADLPGRVPYCPYARDLARARKLVRASGTAGSRVTVWATPDYAFGLAMPVGRQVVGLLDALGYRARLKVVDGQGDYFAATLDPSTHVQVAFEGFSSDYPSESGFIMPVLSCSARDNSSARFCDRRLERRLEDALRLQTADPAHAHELWASIEHDLVDLAPWVPLVDRMWVNLTSERLGNFQVHLQLGPLIDRMWVR
jgi:peptide/nickel transport system substrate-binding protein